MRNPSLEFGACEKQGVYDAIYKRRDVRGHFLADPVPDALLYKLLDAAHHTGSVGFMQPWSFIIIRSEHVKRQVKNLFQEANEAASKVFEGEKREIYSRLKLEGILESPLNICFTCDPTRNGPHVLGRHTIPETDVYSTCCAVQTFWLAARAEGIGVGWVSVIDPVKLRQVLRIPSHVIPVAYLCVGYVSEFAPRPELESAGWLARLPLEELIFYDNGKRKLWSNRGLPAMTCRLLLVRHATADGNGRFQGQRDVSLTSAGRRELRLLCEKCSWHPVRAVYSSDLRRARQTAAAVARNFGLEVEVRPELREMHFGQWEGLSWNQIARRFPRLAPLWIDRFPHQTIPGAEPLSLFKKRIAAGVHEIVTANRGQCALIVTHAGVIRFTLGKVLGLPARNLFRLAQDSCAINVIDYLENGAVVRCING